ncbi:MAG: 30S ribosomal protein S6 [Chloroflexi bacterium RBG_13_53_26]|nr:MAG: 30S ribosomal protein S6 [Chloroflexi bacterium RBG_13_53_26]
MRDYELTVVFSPEITEEDLPAEIDRVNDLITQKGGVVGEVNRWGRKRLAYPIKKHREGNYVLTPLRLQPDVAPELEKNLQGLEQILRYLLVRVG